MGVNQRMIRTVLLAAFFLAGAGCSLHHHATPTEESSSAEFPEQIYVYPAVNDYKHSRVGVFGFSEPSYACGTGRVAAEAVFDDLLKKGVFSYVINEAKQEYTGKADSLALARSRGYDLIITGDVLYYFEDYLVCHWQKSGISSSFHRLSPVPTQGGVRQTRNCANKRECCKIQQYAA